MRDGKAEQGTAPNGRGSIAVVEFIRILEFPTSEAVTRRPFRGCV